jgi:H+/Cl- antiporter ClcA
MTNRFKTLTEESVLFLSILKWVTLSSGIGAIVGSATSLFLSLLSRGLSLTSYIPTPYLLLPIALFFSHLIIHYLSPDSEGHGTEKVISAIHRRSGNIRFRVVPIKLIATIITLAFGGSAGKEGPCAQIGAALSSGIAKLFRFSKLDRKTLVICGISAGFAAVFGTPIAGAIFGVEVLFVGRLMYSVLLPSFVSGMVSYQVASLWGVSFDQFAIPVIPDFSLSLFLTIIFVGCIFGILSVLLIHILNWGGDWSKKLSVWPPLRGIIGGVLLIGIAEMVSPDYLGLGLHTIDAVLHGQHVAWYAPLVKMITTSITLGSGGSGGILTPIFFVGVTSGAVLGDVLGLPMIAMAAIGFVSLLAGAANTPIAACILAVELFGSDIAPYATISCVVSFLMTGYRSVFPSQVLSIAKAPSFVVKTGQELDDTEIHMDYQTLKKFGKGRNILKSHWKKFWKFKSD